MRVKMILLAFYASMAVFILGIAFAIILNTTGK